MRDYWLAAANMVSPTLDEIRDSAGWLRLSSGPSDTSVHACELGGIHGAILTPGDAQDDVMLLCLHGGGFVSGSSESHVPMYGHLAKAVGCRAFVLDYPLAPEHPFPAATDVCFEAYRHLCETIDCHRLFIIGDSAGGNLAALTCQRAAETGLPAAAGLVLFSPWLDLSLSSPSLERNRARDPFFHKERLQALLDAYLMAEHERTDPRVSPLFGDLSGLPPLYIQVGGDEGLLDDSVRFADAARQAGADVTVDVFPAMPHVFQATVGRDRQATAAIDMAAAWVGARIATERS